MGRAKSYRAALARDYAHDAGKGASAEWAAAIGGIGGSGGGVPEARGAGGAQATVATLQQHRLIPTPLPAHQALVAVATAAAFVASVASMATFVDAIRFYSTASSPFSNAFR